MTSRLTAVAVAKCDKEAPNTMAYELASALSRLVLHTGMHTAPKPRLTFADGFPLFVIMTA